VRLCAVVLLRFLTTKIRPETICETEKARIADLFASSSVFSLELLVVFAFIIVVLYFIATPHNLYQDEQLLSITAVWKC
jgi:hypothetical protein